MLLIVNGKPIVHLGKLKTEIRNGTLNMKVFRAREVVDVFLNLCLSGKGIQIFVWRTIFQDVPTQIAHLVC